MATVNTKRTRALSDERLAARTEADAHLNFMGGHSFDLSDPILRLRCMAASCFFGEPQYYRAEPGERPQRGRGRAVAPRPERHLGDAERRHLHETLGALDPRDWRDLTPAQALERAIDEALAHDAAATLELAVQLRRDDHIRVTPQVIAVRAANHKALKGSGLVRRYARAVLGRADEPATQLAYQLATYGDAPIPNGLKRAWADYLGRTGDYALAKYRMDGRRVKTVDVVNLAHPFSPAVDKLVKGELKLGADRRDTWESIRSAGRGWEEAIPVMGHMALLRNIRNFEEAKVSPKLWTDRFIETAADGKQLPFRYFSAFREVEKVTRDGRVLDAIEGALELSLGNLPILPGRSLVLTDNSGSATNTTTSSMGTMKVSTIGNLMGILTARISEDGGELGLFGDQLEMMAVRRKASVLSQLKEAEAIVARKITGSTEHGIWLGFDRITAKRERFDNIFVYSDMQAGHGGLYGRGGYPDFTWMGSRGHHAHVDVPKLIQRYRKTVNPRVNVFLVQIAGYEDTLVPEYYDRTFILGGWSDGLLRFARRMLDLQLQRA